MKWLAIYVKDTVLYTRDKPDVCHVHTKTRERMRLTDGVRHKVKVWKATPKTS